MLGNYCHCMLHSLLCLHNTCRLLHASRYCNLYILHSHCIRCNCLQPRYRYLELNCTCNYCCTQNTLLHLNTFYNLLHYLRNIGNCMRDNLIRKLNNYHPYSPFRSQLCRLLRNLFLDNALYLRNTLHYTSDN